MTRIHFGFCMPADQLDKQRRAMFSLFYDRLGRPEYHLSTWTTKRAVESWRGHHGASCHSHPLQEK